MGKCNVVVDFGNGITKVGAFHKNNGKCELFSGAVFDTPAGGLSEPETLQNLSLHLEKLAVKSGDLHIVLSVDDKTTLCTEAEYPMGTAKDISAIVKNNLSSLIPEDEDQFSCSWRLMDTYPSGQGKFQIAATKTATMELLHDVAEKHRLHLKSADITINAIESLSTLLQHDRKYGLSSSEDAVVLVDVGYKSAQIVVLSRDKIISATAVPHNLYRLDKIIMTASPDLKKDPNIIPELLKFNSSYVSRISQYSEFIEALTTEIIRCVKQSVSGESRYRLTTVYFTGGMYKMPTLVSAVKDSFDVPCFAFPINDFMQLNEGSIAKAQKKAAPTADLFAASLGVLIGGN